MPKGQTPEEGHIVKELKLDEEARKAWRKDEELTGGETWGNRGIAGWDTEGNEDQKEEEEEEGEVAGNEKGKKVVVVKQETVQEAILRQILETERRLVEQAKGQKNPAPAGKSSTKVGAGAAPLKPATLVAQPGKAGSATAEKAAISNPAAAATVQAKVSTIDQHFQLDNEVLTHT